MRYIGIALLTLFAEHVFALGDPKMGESKAVICGACHGPQGISPTPIWPNLAGQHAAYLRQQLQAFKSGKHRSAPTMTPMALGLSEQDMDDLAAYYARKPLAPSQSHTPHAADGERLYRQGDNIKHIPACTTCHGPDGRGNAEAGFPVISHQQVDYIMQQLQAFKAETRSTDPLSIMRTISSKLRTKDMRALAEYLAELP